ncbi:MAG: S24 family peptidase [Candidatus Kapaibacterium sp.]
MKQATEHGRDMGKRSKLSGGHLRARLRKPSPPGWPLIGAIPAGPLSESQDEIQRNIRSIEDLVPNIRPEDFFLIVDGDSMIGAGLEPGGYVVIRPGATPAEGDICAVWIDGEGGTLKRVYSAGDGMVRLVPENPRYQPQTYPSERVTIQGVLVASVNIRQFRR